VAGARPLATRIADAFGTVLFEHLPRGQYEVRAVNLDGAVARSNFQVASAFGNEQAPGSDVLLTLRIVPKFSFTVLDEKGQRIVNARARIGKKVLPILTTEEWFHSQEGVIDIVGIAQEDITQFHFFAPGYEAESLATIDSATGAMLKSFPATVRLAPQLTRAIEFDISRVSGAKGIDVYAPEILNAASSTSQWLFYSSVKDHVLIEPVPQSIDVFAVGISNRRAVGFFSIDASSNVQFIPAATLAVKYTVGDSIPEGAYIRAHRIQSRQGSEAPAPGISSHRNELCGPDGTVRFEGLLPGRYRLEPHFHYSVFGDGLTEFDVEQGAVVESVVQIRRGSLIRVRVKAPSQEFVSAGVVEIHSVEVPVYRMDSAVGLDRSGEALIGGLDPEATYTLRYRSIDSTDDSSATSLTVAPPHPSEVIFTLRNDPGQVR
jgi:hypothetical protein